MLKIALPNKGALSEGAVALFKEAGYKCKRSSRELIVVDQVNQIEFIYLRPRDIAVYVSKGIVNLGITGRDLAIDSTVSYEELIPLKFGSSKFFFAVPNELDILPGKDFEGKRIATSYRQIVQKFLDENDVNATVVKLDGAVEVSIELDVADIIADVVESGRTLKEAGLKTIGDPIMKSEAIFIANNNDMLELSEVQILMDRLKGVLTAREYAMIEYDVPEVCLPEAQALTPGLEAPTVSPLAKDGWYAVKALITRSKMNNIMDDLKKVGAKGILVSELKACRL
ncbi:MAG: ATP phosphoribosyltransferase [Lentisphaeria bacterium]|nr:ATP phosphoribosyltransferase [Lentisphaeria bacterium]